MSVKRSEDVTATAIILFFGSGFLIALGIFVVWMNLRQKSHSFGILFVLAWIYAVPAAWGSINGLGIMRLRRWARGSTLAMSALAACFFGFIVIGFLTEPFLVGRDPEFAHLGLVFGGLGLLSSIPLGIAIWWLVLFTRPRVKRQFEAAPAESEDP